MIAPNPDDTVFDLSKPKAELIEQTKQYFRARQAAVHDQIVSDCVSTFNGPLSALPDILHDLQEYLAEDAGESLACEQSIQVLVREWNRFRERA